MSRIALADALTDFGSVSSPAGPFPLVGSAAPAPSPGALSPRAPSPGLPEEQIPPQEPKIDIEAIVAEAVAAAEAALQQRLAKEHAATLAAAQERHAAELGELERWLAGEASERIAVRFSEMEQQIIEKTSAVTSRILHTTLSDSMRERSLERLATLISEAMADSEAVRLRLHGSLPLFEALKERLPDHCNQLDFTEQPSFDLSLSIDDSIYETRLAEWSAALAETVA